MGDEARAEAESERGVPGRELRLDLEDDTVQAKDNPTTKV